MAAKQAAQKISLFKRGWNEIPEVMFAGFVAGIGLVGVGVCVWMYRRLGDNVAMHKLSYTVIRDTDIKDDPNSKKYN